MEELKRIENPAEFLMTTGLLFEINRRVLHPLGLALEISLDDETGESRIGGIWDYREDPEGITFEKKTFEHGLKKWEQYRDTGADRKIAERKALLGYVVQGED
jgi:hypothetical protein